MAVQPFPNPKFRAFDANGDPLAGGLLYTYAAGTTTPLATYTTRAGSVANANPVVLSANGEADVWTTPGVDYKFELRNSAGVVQWTVDNIPSPSDEESTTFEAATEPGGRLSLATGDPVTLSDITGATIVYYVPYKHDKIPLYDGSAWASHTIATELSQTTADTTKSPAAVANNSNYDLFIWLDSATLRLSRGPPWSSDTSRGTGVGTTELERVNGRYVNKVSISNGPGAQRGLYVGTVRSDGSAQINDTAAKRHVWNNCNRVLRLMYVFEATDSWNYTTATLRQANGSTANQLDFVLGLTEDCVRARVHAFARNTAGNALQVGVGLDSTSAKAAGSTSGSVPAGAANNVSLTAEYSGVPANGRHFLAWLEFSTASGTTLW
ncbi:MAG: hypothetical protein ACREXY_19965, partial [Gammaproteobacteria bacterium]